MYVLQRAVWWETITHGSGSSYLLTPLYSHIARGFYYGSYRTPRIGVWVIGTIIFFLMMAVNRERPKLIKINVNVNYKNKISDLAFIMKRTKALDRIGPHNIDFLSLIICGMLRDWWADKISSKFKESIRFHIEQGIKNEAYIMHLKDLFLNLGYCSDTMPKLIKKYHKLDINKNICMSYKYNYRLTLFTFSSLNWIYDSFYINKEGIKVKILPVWIEDYITPLGLSHWIMQDGSRQNKQGIYIATNSFTYEECIQLSQILIKKFNLKVTVIKTGRENQWRISIWKESMEILSEIIKPYVIEEMKYKFVDYI